MIGSKAVQLVSTTVCEQLATIAMIPVERIVAHSILIIGLYLGLGLGGSGGSLESSGGSGSGNSGSR